MDFDWKAVVGTVAPALGTILGGPLAGGAIKILADKILGGSSGDEKKDADDLQAVLQADGLSPEIRAKLIEAENEVKLAVIAADVKKAEMAVDVEKSYITDVANARASNANTTGILNLGYFINFASYSVIILVLCGCYWLISGKTMATVDPALAAIVGGLVGGVVQWLMSNAAQANSFFFGSSPTARANSAALAASVSEAVTTSAKKS